MYTQKNPADCQWSDFGDWLACSETCGEGFQVRIRKVVTEASGPQGRACDGEPTEIRRCSLRQCPVEVTTTTTTTTEPPFRARLPTTTPSPPPTTLRSVLP